MFLRLSLHRLMMAVAVLLLLWAPARADRSSGAFEKHYVRAIGLYKAEKYDEAIQEFQAAYAIRQLPRVLLNLGQAHRKLGHAKEALGFYEFYLRVEPNPKVEIKTELDGYIAQTKAMLSAAVRVRDESQAAQERAAQERTLEEQAAAAPSKPAPVPDLRPAAPAPDLRPTAPVAAAVITPRPALVQVQSEPLPAPPLPHRSRKALWIGLGIAAGVLVAGAAVTGALLATSRPTEPALALENAR